MNIVLRILFLPIIILCTIITLLCNLLATLFGWLFRIIGIITIILAIYCNMVQWTEDQQYITTMLIIGIVLAFLPVLLEGIAFISCFICELIKIKTERRF